MLKGRAQEASGAGLPEPLVVKNLMMPKYYMSKPKWIGVVRFGSLDIFFFQIFLFYLTKVISCDRKIRHEVLIGDREPPVGFCMNTCTAISVM